MAGPLMGMLSQAGGAMFGQQVGQALGGLAGEVVSSTDIGLPLGPERVAAVLPAGVEAFGEGLEHPASDVLLYVVLRECAHHRLFHHSPWLRPALVGAIEEFGRGTRIDVSAIESQMQRSRPVPPRGHPGSAVRRPVRARAHARAAACARPARDPARLHRGLGRRGRRPGDQGSYARRRPARRGDAPAPCRRRTRPSRRSPRSSASSCGRASCARRRRCGRRCATGRDPTRATPCGATPT